ncbi:hypothetical protein QFZ22_000198 [Streptomyces canus]|uniref:STAS domain-containing protein n=1 Tax=Streptomyces canus TaxID=58343 RepID=A0AAW8F357_9ACTN|nr:hypothetical protein [Streptomyces canus]MDQ0904213.1 hypothetical protein [Streptomyces canus]
MTNSPNSPDQAWVLKATIWAEPAAAPQWKEQLNRLRPIASFDDTTKTWQARLGVLDLEGLNVLQALLDAASAHGTRVRLEPAPVPECWDGPVFTRGPDVAALLEAQADQGRPLGQLLLG